MSKHYEVQVRLDKNWHWIQSFTCQRDAMHNLQLRSGDEKYPMRVVRIVKTVVMNEER